MFPNTTNIDLDMYIDVLFTHFSFVISLISQKMFMSNPREKNNCGLIYKTQFTIFEFPKRTTYPQHTSTSIYAQIELYVPP